MDIKAYVSENEKAELKGVQLQEIGADELLVKITGTGLCHTDLGVMHAAIPTPSPIVLGHEGAGVVVKTGESVTEFEEGDRVVISFNYCGKCANCLQGVPSACENFFRYNFGESMETTDSKVVDNGKKIANLFGQSSLATHSVCNERNAVKIEDESIDLALLGPLACGIQTGVGTVLNKLEPGFGESIVIFGCGSVGLSAVMGANLAHCKHIIAVDVQEERLSMAEELGATHVINGEKDDPVKEVQRITGGGAHYSVESSGVPAVVLQAIRSVRALGTIAVVGAAGELEFHIHDELIPSNKTLVGVVEGQSVPKLFIPEMITYYKEGKLPFDKMVRKYRMDELDNAIKDMESGKTYKPVIVFDDDRG
ncbi:aryl-alcohol dehydrogenase [Alteribacillus persepolensis]|uniref:Aryl-alcohol dehydrogenase n=1 Tax=Alteribacillus persepolensis TaxID=568899 RepID=A0A1G8GY26_9BACI|nr:NAD(P)-dependent alcohol dehydrogenase [Alteribacillus persepolensis]SDH99140.1 aryl-alcohol dehydrogenase [Alteribacillus persepolensis]